MSITKVVETMGQVPETGDHRGREKKYTRGFLVTSDDVNERPFTILTDARIPGPGTFYEFYQTAFFSGARADRVSGHQYLWKVTVNYSTEAGDTDEEEEENPLNEPAKISYSNQDVMIPVTEETDGTAILNTAGLPYEQQVERHSFHDMLTVVQNQATYDKAGMRAFKGRVNSSTFDGADVGTMLCKISATNEHRRGLSFWVVTYEFIHNPDGWNPKILSTGLMELDGDDWKRIKDSAGETSPSPSPLSALGTPLGGSSLPDLAVTTEHTIYLTADFNQLRLPISR